MAKVKGKGLIALFKRKDGGTMIGNTLRGVVNRATGGLLGNGLLIKRPGTTGKTTMEDLRSVAVASTEAGLLKSAEIVKEYETSNNKITTNTMKEKILIFWNTRRPLAIVILVVSGLGVAYLLYKKFHKGNRRR